jgi:hypothetical protein
MADPLKLSYKIFLEAEDVSQSRILSCTSYLNKVVDTHRNPYIRRAVIDNENDMDEFVLRLYIDETVEEETCTGREDAEGFVDELAALLNDLAHAQSFLEMEGSFAIDYEGEHLSFSFTSEAGASACDFKENI